VDGKRQEEAQTPAGSRWGEERSVFRNLSPLDHRYWHADRALFEALADHLSEDASVRACLRVEVALLQELARIACPEVGDVGEALRALPSSIDPSEVYEEETRTQHNIRALVNVLERHVPASLRHLVHVGATSVDILDTANALRIRDVTRRVILPLLIQTEGELIRHCRAEAETPQVGRTHGQHAVPLTFGFAMAEYVSRLGKSIEQILRRADDLRGKLAGAVGAYNATSLVSADPVALEARVLGSLGIAPTEHATQLVEPEYLLRLLLEVNVAFGIVANLADDLRNLQRTEIGEVRESFGAAQVGSSTMPQKRNPWNSEHVKSMWKAFAPRVFTFFMDQISEHQRDLTNSASGRFVAEYLAGFASAVARMRDVLRHLRIDRPRMAENLRHTGDAVLAEPLYVLLALSGVTEAHEAVRGITVECEREGLRLVDALRRRRDLWARAEAALDRVGLGDAERFFGDPTAYRGIAARKAVAVASEHQERMERLEKELHG
jgi:adenylosuccinate lyase